MTGPTCVGKTTVLRELEERSNDIDVAITHTTRAPRAGERDGRDYYFVDHSTFRTAQEAKAFIDVTKVAEDLYGLSRQELISPATNGLRAVALDPPGAMRVNRLVSRSEVVFLLPPNVDLLVERLSSRLSSSGSANNLERRLEQMHLDIAMGFNFTNTIVNSNIDQTVNSILSLVE